MTQNHFQIEAKFWEPDPSGKIICGLCPRFCKIKEGDTGFCGARKNEHGKLFTLIYGRLGAIMISAIEKKPMFHFHPGSRWLSLGTFGCNFRCPSCQNFDLAHTDAQEAGGKFIAPEALTELALSHHCLGISFTYNEPSIWIEYVLEVSQCAKKKGLLINLVTNGYISELAREPLFEMTDAYRVDLKGYYPETYQKLARIKNPEQIRANLIRAKQKGIWLELVTNLIPGVNDQDAEIFAVGKWIREELGEETPWHLTRFFPAFQWHHLPATPIEKMESALKLAKELGLKFVYLGNLPGHFAENTYCPKCGKLLIERRIFGTLKLEIKKEGACPFCHQKIPGHFQNAQEGICDDERI